MSSSRAEEVRSGDPAVRYEVIGHAAVVTIARPAVRNAVNPAVASGIEAALDRAESDPHVAVVVLTGEPPVFCAGADLGVVGDGGAARLSTSRGGFAGIVRRQRRKPVIAAIEGAALAGGLEIVLACDLAVASREAVFGLPEVKRGLVAGGGGAFRLGRRLPLVLAVEACLTGETFDALTAHRHGLLNELCPAGEAVARALMLAERIAENSPLAVQESLALVTEGTAAPDREAWALSEASTERVLAGGDVREGVHAFFERRPPQWSGR